MKGRFHAAILLYSKPPARENTTYSVLLASGRVKEYAIMFQSYFRLLISGIILSMPRILGITGNIACGKTAVGQILLDMGAERYIDADAVVHGLYLSGQPIAVQVARAFGQQVIAP